MIIFYRKVNKSSLRRSKRFTETAPGLRIWEFSIFQNTYVKKLTKEFRNLSSFLWREYNKLERKNEI
jgi:hypothetical protein